MILKYNEALNKATNPEWFKSFYKKDEVATDEEVDQINALVKMVGEDKLFDYFQIREDMLVQQEYVEDLIWYLTELKEGRNPNLED